MAFQNDEQTRDLLHSQAHILNHAFNFVNSMSLKCAIELQIPNIINRHGAPMLLSELVEALSISKERSQHIYRLMRILVHSGFFDIQILSSTNGEEKEGYLLAPASRLLLQDEPFCITPLFLAFLDPTMMDPWQNMSKWFHSDSVNAFQKTHGKLAYEMAGQEPKLNQSINEAMASDGRLVAAVILKHCKGIFEGLDSIVDVGGGTGTLAKCIAEAFPNLHCTNFDLPHVVKGLEGAFLDPTMMDPWQNMSKWFHSDSVNAFHKTHGKLAYEMAGQDPKLNQSINEAMASDGRLVAAVILKHCKGIFEGLDSIVDVGGGTGTLAKCIAEAFPNLHCTNFDLPHVVKGLEGGKNLSFVGGDMFKAIPKANAVLFKWVFHNWNDEECIKIMKLCKEAIPRKENGGKLIIIEMVVKNEERGNKILETQLFYDMFELTLATGKQRSEKEWAKLFTDSGFSDYKITPVLGLRSVIEVYP
ncbi:trans-resveratrol di-O-methyltransferase-like protein [Tanacetum coccineum]